MSPRAAPSSLAFLLLLAVAASAEEAPAPALRLLGQSPPNLLEAGVGPSGGKVALTARIQVEREAPLYVKVVPAPDAVNHAYRNGSATPDHGARVDGWTHHLLLLREDGTLLERDARGEPARGDLGYFVGDEPTTALLLVPGRYQVRSILEMPAGAAPEEGLAVQVRYHIALAAAQPGAGRGGGIQDPAVAAEWNLLVRHAADPEALGDVSAPRAPYGIEGREAPAAAAAGALAALALAGFAVRPRGGRGRR